MDCVLFCCKRSLAMLEELPQLIAGQVSRAELIPWIQECGVLFFIVVVLFVWTALRRHKMDLALTFEGTQSSEFVTVPERRWTYDHDYMVRFLEALCRRSQGKGSDWLEYYAGPILKLDIAFAVSFAAFIVLASLLLALYLGASPWLLRASFVTSAMGIVYGFADVAEDLKLQGILRNAASIYARKISDTPDELQTSLADAAEVDAANGLTRMKMATIALSLVGAVAFVVLQEVAAAVIFLVSNRPSGGARPTPQRKVA